MKKGILIVGKRESGKSWLSKILTSEMPKEDVYRIHGRSKKDHLKDDLKYCLCNENTSVFFVDDVKYIEILNVYANAVKNQSVTIMSLNKSIIEINPRIIINCDEELMDEILEDFDSKYSDYFKLINTSEPLKIIDVMALMDSVTHSQPI